MSLAVLPPGVVTVIVSPALTLPASGEPSSSRTWRRVELGEQGVAAAAPPVERPDPGEDGGVDGVGGHDAAAS